MISPQWIAVQDDYRGKVTQHPYDLNELKYIGGVDISFNKINNKLICAYLTVMEYNGLKVVYEDWLTDTTDLEYISGYLAFREVPYYARLLRRLTENVNFKQFYPQVVLVDGCGILHQKCIGSASHLGVEIGMRTIGVSKTLMCIDGLDERLVKNKFRDKSIRELDLTGDSGIVHGRAVVYGTGSINPIYVSVGTGLSLDNCTEIVRRCTVHRIPEPIRISDIRSKLHWN
jgi:deoxyinosine 3'endonuclease (endonuclease V)